MIEAMEDTPLPEFPRLKLSKAFSPGGNAIDTRVGEDGNMPHGLGAIGYEDGGEGVCFYLARV